LDDRFWIGEVRHGREDLHRKIYSDGHSLDGPDIKILILLDKSTLELIRMIAVTMIVGHPTVSSHLHSVACVDGRVA
jgi:hypothetical protein